MWVTKRKSKLETNIVAFGSVAVGGVAIGGGRSCDCEYKVWSRKYILFEAFEIEDTSTKDLIRPGKENCLKPKLLEILLKSKRHRGARWRRTAAQADSTTRDKSATAAVKLQKLYRGYRIRCRLGDTVVLWRKSSSKVHEISLSFSLFSVQRVGLF
uniref:Uncharacterized protein n=1 Tax=Cannabis sativa TaxID=3483 RepID=A0A803PBM0_CANSA